MQRNRRAQTACEVVDDFRVGGALSLFDILCPISVLVIPRRHARRIGGRTKELVEDRKSSHHPSSVTVLDGGMILPSNRCKTPVRWHFSWSWGNRTLDPSMFPHPGNAVMFGVVIGGFRALAREVAGAHHRDY